MEGVRFLQISFLSTAALALILLWAGWSAEPSPQIAKFRLLSVVSYAPTFPLTTAIGPERKLTLGNGS